MDIKKFENEPISKVGQALQEMIDNDEIKFDFYSTNNEGSVFSYVQIIMWPLVLTGFRIIKTSFKNSKGEYIGFVPPSIRASKETYINTFWLHNPELWKKLNTRALEHYYQHKKQSYEQK